MCHKSDYVLPLSASLQVSLILIRPSAIHSVFIAFYGTVCPVLLRASCCSLDALPATRTHPTLVFVTYRGSHWPVAVSIGVNIWYIKRAVYLLHVEWKVDVRGWNQSYHFIKWRCGSKSSGNFKGTLAIKQTKTARLHSTYATATINNRFSQPCNLSKQTWENKKKERKKIWARGHQGLWSVSLCTNNS